MILPTARAKTAGFLRGDVRGTSRAWGSVTTSSSAGPGEARVSRTDARGVPRRGRDSRIHYLALAPDTTPPGSPADQSAQWAVETFGSTRVGDWLIVDLAPAGGN
jgi:hypothetical protein